MSSQHHERRIKLVNAPLQVKLTSIFVGMAALSLFLQVVLFMRSLSELAHALPNDGAVLWGEMRSILAGVFFTSAVAFLPLIFLVGVLVTFRIAGPLHRFETYLRQIVRGEEPRAVRLRKGDELQELSELLNRAIEVTRAKAALPARAPAEPPPTEAAAETETSWAGH